MDRPFYDTLNQLDSTKTNYFFIESTATYLTFLLYMTPIKIGISSIIFPPPLNSISKGFVFRSEFGRKNSRKNDHSVAGINVLGEAPSNQSMLYHSPRELEHLQHRQRMNSSCQAPTAGFRTPAISRQERCS
ncbi:MAG: hypothetical protein CR997_03735 [Acidobacteria bacterium]|nr:MAG: hypothetical protein CR997_03735 [Acidobacteriota bacterium]